MSKWFGFPVLCLSLSDALACKTCTPCCQHPNHTGAAARTDISRALAKRSFPEKSVKTTNRVGLFILVCRLRLIASGVFVARSVQMHHGLCALLGFALKLATCSDESKKKKKGKQTPLYVSMSGMIPGPLDLSN